jgi:rare lipoprotein A (peptidoglycan hydrolase)
MAIFKKSILFISLLVFCSTIRFAHAAEPVTVDLLAGYGGKTISAEGAFQLGIREGILVAPVRVLITPDAVLPASLPLRYTAAGRAFAVDITQADGETKALDVLWFKVLAAPVPNTSTVLLGYSPQTNAWQIIGTKLGADNLVAGASRFLDMTVVPVTDNATSPGAFGPDVSVTPVTRILNLDPASGQQLVTFLPYTITISSKNFSNPTAVVMTPSVSQPAPLPTWARQRGSFLQIALRLSDNTAARAAAPGINISPKVSAQNFNPQRILFFNPVKKEWEVTRKNSIFVSGFVVVVDDTREQVGIASWYSSKKNPDGVAHNTFPMGAKLKVTNLENGKSTVVRVVSRGPYVRGRVVDLSYTAFKKIKGKNGGVASVKVAALDPKVLGEPISLPVTPSSPATVGSPVALPITSTAGAVYDVDKGVLVTTKNSEEVHPIASLTKLMTALVYLDRKPSFKNIVTYQKGDSAICACLYLSVGDKVTTKNLWHAMLIGSANNSARALVRSTKLTDTQFVKLMNEKAKALGLTTLTFADPTGLDPANQGSASDMAKLAAIAFSKPDIANTATEMSYSFSTLNTRRAHTIKNQNKILKSGWQITGTKTGYTEESGYCLIGQVKGVTTGRTIVVANLGASSSANQYADMEKAFEVGFANIQ